MEMAAEEGDCSHWKCCTWEKQALQGGSGFEEEVGDERKVKVGQCDLSKYCLKQNDH
jgi:uncharacterized low-complexity protein